MILVSLIALLYDLEKERQFQIYQFFELFSWAWASTSVLNFSPLGCISNKDLKFSKCEFSVWKSSVCVHLKNEAYKFVILIPLCKAAPTRQQWELLAFVRPFEVLRSSCGGWWWRRSFPFWTLQFETCLLSFLSSSSQSAYLLAV